MIPFKHYLSENIKSYTVDDETPATMNGIPFKPVKPSGWNAYTIKLEEPELELTSGLRAASGCIIIEKKSIWIVHPTNGFGGYSATFPKGGLEKGLSLQANAVKETWEESGLLVKITGFALDVTRTTSVARYYFAKRIGGDPTKMGWESEKVSLIPKNLLSKYVTHPADKPILKAIDDYL